MLMKTSNTFFFFFTFILLLFFFRWIPLAPLTGGDWPYLFRETTVSFTSPVSVYRSYFWLGQNTLPFSGVESYFQLSSKVFNNWILTERLFWLFPIIGIGLWSAYVLTGSWVGAFLYMTNTYTLMMIDGGQLGVGFAFALAPFLLKRFIDVFERSRINIKTSIMSYCITGVVFGLEVLFDVRLAYLLLLAAVLYGAVFIPLRRKNLYHSLVVVFPAFGVMLSIALLVNAFWILPMVRFPVNASKFGEVYTSLAMVRFLSFADFSHALSLLHPNWPDNLFGKVYFLQPEFLFLPVVVFGSLLGSSRRNIFFAVLGLVGVFLAKGTNPPFGSLYGWFFQHVPGFIFFRDATKFYLFIALSYATLLPTTIHTVSLWIGKRFPVQKSRTVKMTWSPWVAVIVLFFWIYTTRQAWTGQLHGMFRPRSVPVEYAALKDFLHDQTAFFRTFWIPGRQRFGFFSEDHPAIDAAGFLQKPDIDEVLDWLSQPTAPSQLARWGIKYLIVPYDSEGEFFLTDRQYDERVYQRIIGAVSHLSWIVSTRHIGKMMLFEVPHVKDHFFVDGQAVTYKKKDATSYTITTPRPLSSSEVIFSESYDPYWVAAVGRERIYAQRTSDGLNSFSIPQSTAFIRIEYAPARWVRIGGFVTIGTILTCCLLLIIGWLSGRAARGTV